MYLVLFDMDGTLVDSQAHIVGAMVAAFEAQNLPPPTRQDILSIVGLSLPQAMFHLAPSLDLSSRETLVEGYKSAFVKMRSSGHVSPLYPGAIDCLTALSEMPDVMLGIATGKSRRGVEAVFEMHDLAGYFVTTQVADDHPSKPHPSMVHAALLETGCDAGVVIGDTTYDMEMGRAGGLKTLGVTWGYHDSFDLIPCSDALVERYEQVIPAIEGLRSR